MADALYYREGAQPRVRGFVHSSFSYCLRMSVENAPTTANTHTHRHTFQASSYSFRQESDFRGGKKHTLKSDIETSRQKQTPTIQSVQSLLAPQQTILRRTHNNEICSASIDMCCNKKSIHYVNADTYDT